VTRVERSGCLVVLEYGAEWPTSVFRRTSERDCVLVAAREPDETLGTFFVRLARRVERAARHAVSIRTVIVACSGHGDTAPDERLLLLQGIARQVVRDQETRFVIVGDESAESGALLMMADTLLEHLRGEPVTVHVVSRAVSGRSLPAWCTRGASALSWSA
jgi:hypothetical protein